jgi:hypothetical protein
VGPRRETPPEIGTETGVVELSTEAEIIKEGSKGFLMVGEARCRIRERERRDRCRSVPVHRCPQKLSNGDQVLPAGGDMVRAANRGVAIEKTNDTLGGHVHRNEIEGCLGIAGNRTKGSLENVPQGYIERGLGGYVSVAGVSHQDPRSKH